MDAPAVTFACSAVTICVGFFLMLMGVVIEPLLPLHQVDVVLTREQLADEEIRHHTQEMLQRARGNIPFAWLAAGLAAEASGWIGHEAAVAINVEVCEVCTVVKLPAIDYANVVLRPGHVCPGKRQ
ncbi:MAG: hypothetical protein M3552_14490 [Planctomycetota bacterium]|nr:hypothetical protein [Planctomycetaceae bacterium]MDQ3331838.1 hypothetical protein [Planctomycetota bacterium]